MLTQPLSWGLTLEQLAVPTVVCTSCPSACDPCCRAQVLFRFTGAIAKLRGAGPSNFDAACGEVERVLCGELAALSAEVVKKAQEPRRALGGALGSRPPRFQECRWPRPDRPPDRQAPSALTGSRAPRPGPDTASGTMSRTASSDRPRKHTGAPARSAKAAAFGKRSGATPHVCGRLLKASRTGRTVIAPAGRPHAPADPETRARCREHPGRACGWPSRATCGTGALLPQFADVGQIGAEFGQICTDVRQDVSESVRCWPEVGRCRPDLSKCGPNSANFGV